MSRPVFRLAHQCPANGAATLWKLQNGTLKDPVKYSIRNRSSLGSLNSQDPEVVIGSNNLSEGCAILHVYNNSVFLEAFHSKVWILPPGWRVDGVNKVTRVDVEPSTESRQILIQLRPEDAFLTLAGRFTLKFLQSDSSPFPFPTEQSSVVVNLDRDSQLSVISQVNEPQKDTPKDSMGTNGPLVEEKLAVQEAADSASEDELITVAALSTTTTTQGNNEAVVSSSEEELKALSSVEEVVSRPSLDRSSEESDSVAAPEADNLPVSESSTEDNGPNPGTDSLSNEVATHYEAPRLSEEDTVVPDAEHPSEQNMFDVTLADTNHYNAPQIGRRSVSITLFQDISFSIPEDSSMEDEGESMTPALNTSEGPLANREVNTVLFNTEFQYHDNLHTAEKRYPLGGQDQDEELFEKTVFLQPRVKDSSHDQPFRKNAWRREEAVHYEASVGSSTCEEERGAFTANVARETQSKSTDDGSTGAVQITDSQFARVQKIAEEAEESQSTFVEEDAGIQPADQDTTQTAPEKTMDENPVPNKRMADTRTSNDCSQNLKEAITTASKMALPLEESAQGLPYTEDFEERPVQRSSIRTDDSSLAPFAASVPPRTPHKDENPMISPTKPPWKRSAPSTDRPTQRVYGKKRKIMQAGNDDSSTDTAESTIEVQNSRSKKPRSERTLEPIANTPRTPSERSRTLPSSTPSRSLRSSGTTQEDPARQEELHPRIVFSYTQIHERKIIMKFLKAHGGRQVESVLDCDLLCVGKDGIKRTGKFVLAVALGKDIVTDKWLVDSASSRRFLDVKEYLPTDGPYEERWGFTLIEAIERGRQGLTTLLYKTIVYVSPTLKKEMGEGFKELKEIAMKVGAEKVEARMPPKKTPADLSSLVLASDTEVNASRAKKMEGILYSKHLIPLSVLRGSLEVDTDEFVLNAPTVKEEED